MRRPLALCTLALVGGVLVGGSPSRGAEATADKGAKIYCFMRSSGNNHTVSWNAAYAVIKRQGNSMFKTSPEHASVMITESVVKSPESFPNCGRYLGDLFGDNSSSATTPTAQTTATAEETPYPINDTQRYSY